MAKASKTSQTPETKAIIARAKRQIDNGIPWKEAIKEAHEIKDTIQREKAIKAIIDYIQEVAT